MNNYPADNDNESETLNRRIGYRHAEDDDPGDPDGPGDNPGGPGNGG